MRQKLPGHRSGVSADRRNFLQNKRSRYAVWDSCKICPAPWARHICRNENQNVFSSVRSGIFRRNDFQKMPLRRSFSQSGKFSTKISLLAELEHAEFTAEARRRRSRKSNGCCWRFDLLHKASIFFVKEFGNLRPLLF